MRELNRVLLVDDDEDIRVVARLALETVGGLQVMDCSSSAEATVALESFEPDLILLDINLPKLNGYEVCRWLRAEEITRSIPIIIITGHLDFSNREAALEAGANELLTKPIRCEELLTRMRDLLQHDQPAASMERR